MASGKAVIARRKYVIKDGMARIVKKGAWTKLGQQRANGERKMDTPAPLPT